jgi:acyl-CoA reductase-like NAD-dependent aldehyde dehydrogenase
MQQLTSINPSTYEVIGTVAVSSPKEIKDIIKAARVAQKKWSALSLSKRVELVQTAFSALKAHKAEFTLLESQEMGMPIGETEVDFDATMEYVQWYVNNAEKYLSPETTFENDTEVHQVFYEPIGVAAVIVPWNFPFANIVWGAVQSLIAGNTIVLKHSEECPLSGKFIEDILSQHLPSGVFSEVYGDGKVGSELVHGDIDMIAFTGSTKTGKFLYELAGKKFIKAVMELGGSAPGVIFEDADVDLAIGNVCFNRLLNQGQCCDGLKRLIVHESIFDDVVKKVSSTFAAKKVGNAQERTTEIGPLVAKRQLDLLVSQVEDARNKGATIVVGGNSLESKLGGAFFEPTVVTEITGDMKVWNEEVFGPVLPIMKFKTQQEAIELANNTPYGLGAYIFTQDTKRADEVSKQIHSGMVSVNGTNYIMPFNPFGGYKHSGFGREHGKYGFHEVTQVKVVAKNK